jgi:hypothetical protein
MVTVLTQLGAKSGGVPDRFDVQRARYMTLETIAPLGKDPSSSGPARQPDTQGELSRRYRGTQCSGTKPRDTIDLPNCDYGF